VREAELTDQAARQAAIVHVEGPLVVRAPHGTGKTELIVRRYCHLVQNQLAHPLEIMVVTFSRRAAAEMRERLQLRLDQDLERLPITTYHAAARSILTMKAASDKETLRIADPPTSYRLVEQAMKDGNLNPSVWPPRSVYDLIIDAKERGKSPEDFLSVPDSPSMLKVADVFYRYEGLLRDRKSSDFPGLILGAHKLLSEDDEMLTALCERYRFIMVDEWQDSSPGQYEFLRLLALHHHNFMVVGAGEPQSIYEWRRADFRELDRSFREDFPDAPPEADIVLTNNLRSTTEIVKAAGAVFEGKYPELNLVAQRGSGEKVHDVRVSDEQAEAGFVAEEALKLARQGAAWNGMAVLFRTNEQSLLIERQLMAHHIPYVLQGRQRLYHRREVRDILAYLTLSQGENASAVNQIVNTPARGIGPVSLRKLKGDQVQVTESRLTLAVSRAKEIGLNARAVEGIQQLQALLADLRQRRATRPADLITRVVEATGYRAWLQGEMDGETQLQSLRLLSREAEEYRDVPEFLGVIQAHIAEDMERPENEGVTLQTIHTAKGLQFPTVFVVGMEEGLLPYARAQQSGETGERRLAHVAISRARDRVYLVSAQSRADRNGRRTYPRPSRYLAMLPKDVVERLIL
jgi:DNA helicase-2/ATP-dependent DNA helicase PcrA